MPLFRATVSTNWSLRQIEDGSKSKSDCNCIKSGKQSVASACQKGKKRRCILKGGVQIHNVNKQSTMGIVHAKNCSFREIDQISIGSSTLDYLKLPDSDLICTIRSSSRDLMRDTVFCLL
eukprot:gnl/MRDRNA2_/MRDRNA2_31380_c0_seq1.p1 gnl/MRDRNA2_/MRDRNA2_31380_c0~~gnl/MRDRNA2_/MRDRNA2_31380_c0_seq1.p1  ORF type:complete len:120 (+),score=10.13 gnl/MRDRNA2_/MRDRNA2_31380_c0_seq1:370-729(+)